MTTTTLSENNPFVTKHRYRCGQIVITMGWDNSHQGYFLVIRKDEDPWDPFWSSMEERHAFPKTIKPFLRILKALDLSIPEDMVHELERDPFSRHSKITWHLDGLYTSNHMATHHHFYTLHQGTLTHIHMGWNISLEGFFMSIKKEGAHEEPFWSNLGQRSRRYHYPQSLDLFLEVLDEFEITVPEKMLCKVRQDKHLGGIGDVLRPTSIHDEMRFLN